MGSFMFFFSRLWWAAAFYPNTRNLKKKSERLICYDTLHFEAEKSAMASLPDQQHSLDWEEDRDGEDWEAVITDSRSIWLKRLDEWQH